MLDHGPWTTWNTHWKSRKNHEHLSLFSNFMKFYVNFKAKGMPVNFNPSTMFSCSAEKNESFQDNEEIFSVSS